MRAPSQPSPSYLNTQTSHFDESQTALPITRSHDYEDSPVVLPQHSLYPSRSATSWISFRNPAFLIVYSFHVFRDILARENIYRAYMVKATLIDSIHSAYSAMLGHLHCSDLSFRANHSHRIYHHLLPLNFMNIPSNKNIVLQERSNVDRAKTVLSLGRPLSFTHTAVLRRPR